jgi:hypothetical protein
MAQSDEEVRRLVEHSKEIMRREGKPVDVFGVVDEESEDWIKIVREQRKREKRQQPKP